MVIPRPPWLAHAARVALVMLLCLACLHARAQDIPWRKLRLDLQASNEPLSTFLGRVLTPNGIAATLSPPIATARVNGHLQGTAESIFHELVDTYGLTWYHDGSVLYVYSLGEMESRMLQVAPGDVPRVERSLREMRLLDARFPLRLSGSEGRLLVTGPPQYVRIVSDVAASVAQAPTQTSREVEVRVFRLRHARAADTVVSIAGTETTIPGVARILNETLGASRIDVAAPPSRALPVALAGLRGKGQIAVGRGEGVTVQANDQPAFTADPDAAPLAGRGPSVATTQPAIGEPPPPAVPGAPRSPRSSTDGAVRADPRINAVIVRDTRERFGMYAQLIADLDVPTPLLEIEATVIDVSRDKSDELGIDWRLHGQRADIVSSPNGLAGPQGSGNEAGNLLYNLPAQSSGSAGLVGTLIFGSQRTNFLARVNALTLSGDANTVSRPRVLTLDNTEAVLQSTQDFYVRVAGRDQVDLFNVTLGLVLRVTPTLIENADGSQVKLNIRIEDGNTNAGTQVDQIPVVSRNAISTQAVVGNGQSLLIGGYTIDETARNASGVPWLSDIPGLRWLFGQRSTSARRVERIFMITPRLLRPEDVVASASNTP